MTALLAYWKAMAARTDERGSGGQTIEMLLIIGAIILVVFLVVAGFKGYINSILPW